MQIELREFDIITFEGDGLVLPTVSTGEMIEGLAARVKERVGRAIEQEVTAHAPIAVGAALVTEAPNLGVRHLIHVPLVETEGVRVGVENIRRATRAGLLGAAHHSLEVIAIPGMGYGETGVPHDEAARAIIDEVSAFKQTHPLTVYLIDTDEDMVEAFQLQLHG